MCEMTGRFSLAGLKVIGSLAVACAGCVLPGPEAPATALRSAGSGVASGPAPTEELALPANSTAAAPMNQTAATDEGPSEDRPGNAPSALRPVDRPIVPVAALVQSDTSASPSDHRPPAGDGTAAPAPAVIAPATNPLQLAPPSNDSQASGSVGGDSPSIRGPVAVDGQTVEELVQLALATHPKIRAAQQRVAAAAHRITVARSLADPVLGETFWPFDGNALQTAGGRAANQIGLTQGIPWPEKLETQARIVQREVEMARAELDQVRLEIEEAVRLASIEVALASEAIAILNDMEILLQDLSKVAEAMVRSGASQQDILRVELELDRLQQQREDLWKQKRVAQADLAALLSQPEGAAPEVALSLAPGSGTERLEELIRLAEQCNPELRGLAWQIARDRQKQRLADLQRYPDFQVGVNWLVISEQDAISPVATGNDNFGFTVGLTLPVWRDKINAGIQSAAHQTSSSIELLDAQRNVVFGKLRRLIAQADSLTEQYRIYEERIIPRVHHTLEINLADYRGKRSDFFSVIETYRELLVFELQRLKLAASLAGTLVQIERQVGCPPDARP